MNSFSISKVARKLAIFSIMLLVLGSCKKKENSIGSGFHNGDYFASGIYRSTKINAYTTQKDTIITSKKNLNLVGAYEDPKFGMIKSKFGIQVALSVEDPDFGKNPIIDSVILTMPYLGRADTDSTVTFNTDSIYGNKDVPMKLQISELTKFLNPDSTYYSSTELPTSNAGDIYDGMLQFSTDSIILCHRDTTSAGEDTTICNKIPPALRLKLDNDYFQNKILDQQGTANLLTNVMFISEYMNGLVFETDKKDGAIYSFNMLKNTTLSIYYHNNDTPILDGDSKPFKSERFNLMFSSKLSRVNNYEFDKSSADPSLVNQLSPGYDTTNGSDILFIQGMSGIEANVELFTDSLQLQALRDSSWLINRAELVYRVSEDNGDEIGPPFRLMMANRDSLELSSEADYRMIDFVVEPAAFDGYLRSDATILSNSEKRYYKFRITNFVAAILDGELETDENGNTKVIYDDKNNYVIKLLSTSGSEGVSRVMLNGTNTGDISKNLFLEIHYSKKDK